MAIESNQRSCTTKCGAARIAETRQAVSRRSGGSPPSLSLNKLFNLFLNLRERDVRQTVLIAKTSLEANFQLDDFIY